MRILIIGTSKNAEILSNFLAENKELLVFTTKECEGGNFTGIYPENIEEIKDFALANEINLTIAVDDIPGVDYLTEFNKCGLAIFAPDKEAARIAHSKSFGKKFIYKNKIQTPKFAFFEKSNLAIEHIKNAGFPLVIKPDEHSETQTAYIAETFGAAKNKIEKLFQTDNNKILIEDYIYGKEASIYVISDGFRPVILGSTAGFGGDISIKDASFIDKELEEKIYNEIIFPTISSLADEEAEYTGILGFDIIITPKKDVYLIEYNSFFKDIDCEIMLRGTDENWPKIFMDAIIGTLQDDFETPFSIQKKDEFFGAFRIENEIISAEAKTLNMLKEKLAAEGLDREDIRQAEKIWSL